MIISGMITTEANTVVKKGQTLILNMQNCKHDFVGNPLAQRKIRFGGSTGENDIFNDLLPVQFTPSLRRSTVYKFLGPS